MSPLILASGALRDPGWSGLGVMAGLVLTVLLLASWSGVALLRLGLVASARTVVQLVGVGLLLQWLFANTTPLALLALFAAMVAVAAWTGRQRVERALAGTGRLLAVILSLVLALALLLLGTVVLQLESLDPRYLIPLGGIVLGNAMTAGSLAAQRFHDDLRQERATLEAALALGASPAQATQAQFSRALTAALTPTLNAMLIVGIVKLPGVMTGQILGGAPPFAAAKYQILIMFLLLSGDGLTALATLHAVRRLAFTARWQPRV